jgi:two-component system chemotaxis response regulator CheB
VLIIDDSALVCKILSRELPKDPGIEIVGIASDPYEARDKILELKPDVLTLDIAMPRMDGITFLEKLKKYYSMPVVVLSSLTQTSSEMALKALELGALEVMHKPVIDSSYKLQEMMTVLVDKIKAAAQAKHRIINEAMRKVKPQLVSPKMMEMVKAADKIIAIGASTGGVEAVRSILATLPPVFPGIVIAQHMPEHFTKAFAEDLKRQCKIEVREAGNGDSVHPGLALIAPGNYHLLLARGGGRYYVEVKDGPLVCRQRPSADVLFDSVSKSAGKNAIGVILSGMGRDGAEGLLKMKDAGAYTIAQDEASCVVFGMPKAAIEAGAVTKTLPLEDIPHELITQCSS